ncbi:pyridoxamine 5'-phosphate oxidase family protein [Halalkalicoccus salilacus]|uniref:pyridoxamine 5'-phosphate oxidase family protein n=1 Tax=Halalkalicoccus salilacus TaxID=3117459 RepID=UPI00300EAC45
MEEGEIKAFLNEQGVGVLSLARGDEAYGVPISFGYDGEDRLYFVFLGIGERSRKREFAEATERASFVAYEVESKHAWTSVVAGGRVREVADEEWDALEDAIEENASRASSRRRTPCRGSRGGSSRSRSSPVEGARSERRGSHLETTGRHHGVSRGRFEALD